MLRSPDFDGTERRESGERGAGQLKSSEAYFGGTGSASSQPGLKPSQQPDLKDSASGRRKPKGGSSATAATAPQATESGFADPSVVDLRDRTTATVDPTRVDGTTSQTSKGKDRGAGIDRTYVPTPAESERARRDEDWRRRVVEAYTEVRKAERNAELQAQLRESLERIERNAAVRSKPLSHAEALADLRQELDRVPEELKPVVQQAWLQQHMRAALERYERSAAARSQPLSREDALAEIRRDLGRLSEDSRWMLGTRATALAGKPVYGAAPPPATGEPGAGQHWPGPRNPEPPLPNPLWQQR
jgi:hypothetical protein